MSEVTAPLATTSKSTEPLATTSGGTASLPTTSEMTAPLPTTSQVTSPLPTTSKVTAPPATTLQVIGPQPSSEVAEPPAEMEVCDSADAYILDHMYMHKCSCSPDCNCKGCFTKQQQIQVLIDEFETFKITCNVSPSDPPRRTSLADLCIKNDKQVQLNIGLRSKASFDDLLKLVSPRASRMRYWSGDRTKVVSTKVKREFQKTPTKSGPKRKLSIKSELVLVLMKLRLGLTHAFLAMIFGIQGSTCSNIITTWIKFLSHTLRNLVFWPDKTTVQMMMPASFAEEYPNLRCTLDCSETFIDRPRDLKMQAVTWSDYKHHNTLKYLVGISPNGHICFISESWGGRTSDREIVRSSGFLDLVDPTDVIMADRGFTIQEDLLLRQATLLIPPPSSGKNQQSRKNVGKTTKVANARIHVERAINRLKWFKIVSETVPINMVDIFDDILVICSALCNLDKPLVL